MCEISLSNPSPSFLRYLWLNVEVPDEFVLEQITSKDWKEKAPLVAVKK